MSNPEEVHPRDIVTTFSTAVRNPQVIYWFCKDIDGYNGEGTFPVMGCRVLCRYDVHERQRFYEPLLTYDHILNAQRINQRLQSGGAPRTATNYTVIAFKIFDSAFEAPGGRIPLPKQSEPTRGSHAVHIVGYEEGGQTLKFINSWGREWGDDGYGYISRRYLEKQLTDAYLLRRAHIGPTPFKLSRLASARNDSEFTKAWMMKNPRIRGRFMYRGHGHVWVLYKTLSLVDECPVDVIEIRNGQGFIIGWAYLHHLGGKERPTSLLKELFVWPSRRRRGYGTMLEQMACRRARAWRSETIQIARFAADDLQRQLAPVRAFGTALGYTWVLGSQVRPNLKGIGEKRL